MSNPGWAEWAHKAAGGTQRAGEVSNDGYPMSYTMACLKAMKQAQSYNVTIGRISLSVKPGDNATDDSGDLYTISDGTNTLTLTEEEIDSLQDAIDNAGAYLDGTRGMGMSAVMQEGM